MRSWLRVLRSGSRSASQPGQSRGARTTASARDSSANGYGTRVTLDELIALRAEAGAIGLYRQQRVRAAYSGGYVSPFKGRGIDFEEVRAYQPGDDIRNMDWRVTARRGRPHTKLFREERERPVLAWVDQSSSMRFGSRVAFKSVIAARCAALLAWAADANGDRIGGHIFNEISHNEIRPRSRSHGVLPLLRLLTSLDPGITSGSTAGLAGGSTQSREQALERLQFSAKPGSLLVCISDYLDLSKREEQLLQRLARHCDLVVIFVFDPLEAQAPDAGSYPVTDGKQILNLDTREQGTVAAYQSRFANQRQAIEKLCLSGGIHFIPIATDQPLAAALYRGLRTRRGHSGQIYRAAGAQL